jgi:hypothetical protein
MRALTPILLLFLTLMSASAQTSRFSFGAIGGVRLSRGASSAQHDESPRYTAGGTFEASLGDRFAVEADAIYKRLGSSSVIVERFSPSNTAAIFNRWRADSLEFPILAKYYLGPRGSSDRFFVCTGYSLHHSWTSFTSQTTDPGIHSVFLGGPGPSIEPGAVFGAGFTRRNGRLRASPSIRYTRWSLRWDGASPNQLEVLLSLEL